MWQSAALLDTQEHPASARKVRVMRVTRLICSLLLAVGLLAIPVQSRAQVAVGISVQLGPPVLPVHLGRNADSHGKRAGCNDPARSKGGGFNGSTQRSARTHLALKTKAKIAR